MLGPANSILLFEKYPQHSVITSPIEQYSDCHRIVFYHVKGDTKIDGEFLVS